MGRTTINFEYNGTDYSLGYTFAVVKRLVRTGLLAQIAEGKRPLTMTEDLFVAAFEANHSNASNNIRRKIYDEFSETSEDGTLIECLLEMVNETWRRWLRETSSGRMNRS